MSDSDPPSHETEQGDTELRDTDQDVQARMDRLEAENRHLRARLEHLEAALEEGADRDLGAVGPGSPADDSSDDSAEAGTPEAEDPDSLDSEQTLGPQPTAVTSNYKVLGELGAQQGVGVLGQNNASSGTPIGVWGAVPNASTNGFGFFTHQNAKFNGTTRVGKLSQATPYEMEVGNDRLGYITEKTSGGAAGNVYFGLPQNWFASEGFSDAVGRTVSGGGKSTIDISQENVAYDDFATVSGGIDNRAGEDDDQTATSRAATVGGGESNVATGDQATVAGGVRNEAANTAATVPGGKNNTASGQHALAAGRKATASHDGSVVVGDSTSTGISSTSPDEMRVQQDLVARSLSAEKVGAKLYGGIEQTIPSDGSRHQVQWDTVRFDDFGWAQPANNRLTISGPATVQVGLNISWFQIGSGQNYEFFIEKDGSDIAGQIVEGAQHSTGGVENMTQLTQVPAGTTSHFTVSAVLYGLTDRDLSALRGMKNFWVVKHG